MHKSLSLEVEGLQQQKTSFGYIPVKQIQESEGIIDRWYFFFVLIVSCHSSTLQCYSSGESGFSFSIQTISSRAAYSDYSHTGKRKHKDKTWNACLTSTYTTLTVENLVLFQCIYQSVVWIVEHPDIVWDREAPHPFPQWQIRLVWGSLSLYTICKVISGAVVKGIRVHKYLIELIK